MFCIVKYSSDAIEYVHLLFNNGFLALTHFGSAL